MDEPPNRVKLRRRGRGASMGRLQDRPDRLVVARAAVVLHDAHGARARRRPESLRQHVVVGEAAQADPQDGAAAPCRPGPW